MDSSVSSDNSRYRRQKQDEYERAMSEKAYHEREIEKVNKMQRSVVPTGERDLMYFTNLNRKDIKVNDQET